MTKPNVELVSTVAYQSVLSVIQGQDDRKAVRLKDGGVVLVSADGDHVHVLVQSIHFEPGEELPF